jgi:polygalacturonase
MSVWLVGFGLKSRSFAYSLNLYKDVGMKNMSRFGKLLPLLVFAGWLASGLPVKARASVNPELPVVPDVVFSIAQFGAEGDGQATNTAAIQAAIDTANHAGGGTVEVPAGVFLSGPIHLYSKINLRLDDHAVLRMLPLDKYPGGTSDPQTFISGSGLQDVVISGSGMIDGQGTPWWPFARVRGARRPVMIRLSACHRVLIENVTLTNSPMFHIAISGHSMDVTVRKVTIRANPSTDPVNPGHNTDACDVSAKNVLIEDCDVSVGDDNFTCGGGTSDVLITNCTYGYGHGVSIGSPTSGGVSNITVVNCTFNNTESGIRIKSDRDRGGYLHDLTYMNLRMTNVGCPILIYASYMSTNPAYRALNKVTAEIAASYPASPKADADLSGHHVQQYHGHRAAGTPGGIDLGAAGDGCHQRVAATGGNQGGPAFRHLQRPRRQGGGFQNPDSRWHQPIFHYQLTNRRHALRSHDKSRA